MKLERYLPGGILAIARRSVVGGILVGCGKKDKIKDLNLQIVLLTRMHNNTKCGCRANLKFAQTAR